MPTYEFQCVKCGPFEQWRSIHDGPLEACPTCGNVVAKVISIPALHGIGSRGARTREVDATEGRWSKDMAAYKRLRHDGHQPRGIDGCDKLEATAVGDFHIESGLAHTDEKVRDGKEIAREINARADVMTSEKWDAYARTPRGGRSYDREPVQRMRIEKLPDRCKGTVLDVGGSDGYATRLIAKAGHTVKLVDASQVCVDRARDIYGLDAECADAEALPEVDGSWDTVVLAEILEHLDNPGVALAEAFRVARERVVVTLPLYGWADPTHEWRVSLDVMVDDAQRAKDPTKGAQVIVTFQRGKCWPCNYFQTDERWREQFEEVS